MKKRWWARYCNSTRRVHWLVGMRYCDPNTWLLRPYRWVIAYLCPYIIAYALVSCLFLWLSLRSMPMALVDLRLIQHHVLVITSKYAGYVAELTRSLCCDTLRWCDWHSSMHYMWLFLWRWSPCAPSRRCFVIGTLVPIFVQLVVTSRCSYCKVTTYV